MLTETRAELDDFHQASKELEAELESELQRTEKAQQDLRAKVIRAESEREDWKVRLFSGYAYTETYGFPSSLRQSLCHFRRRTIRQLLPFSANSINLDKNTRRPKSIYASWKWETMIWNAMNGLLHLV